MEKEEVAPETEQVEKTVGGKLRAAREVSGKSLVEIAAQTRVPLRMLDALERDAISELPPGPYAAGFARNFARAVGLDPQNIASEVLVVTQGVSTPSAYALDLFEPVATNRVPTRALAWTATIIAVALFVAYMVWKSWLMTPDASDERAATPEVTSATPSATPVNPAVAAATAAGPTIAVDPSAPVRIAASERVWFSLEDAGGRSQFDLTLEGGEFYTLKPAQRSLTLRTGRPQSLRILVGETRVPQLGANDAVVSGVALDPASLMQRINTPPLAVPVPTVTAQP
ncbi:MAG: RodZ domain-containing protein [Pseudomonadota bacterium]